VSRLRESESEPEGGGGVKMKVMGEMVWAVARGGGLVSAMMITSHEFW
jgi:predicted Rdx family selenoprotein